MTNRLIWFIIWIMKQHSFSIHVATTRRIYKGKLYQAHLLRHTYREDGKVKHKTVGNLSHLPSDIIDMIRRSLQGESFVSVNEAFEVIRNLPHGHVAAVLGTLKRIGLDQVIASKRSRQRDLCVAMIVARIIDPQSKLATARGLGEESAFMSLGEILHIESADEDELYEAMDWILPRQEDIEKKLASRHLRDGALVLYDVTSSYFEGRTCPLAEIGHPHDGKKNKLQIVYGVLCNAEGCPVAVEVFKGNTGDPTTFTAQVKKVRERFGIERVIFVGDRGMITEARIREDLRPGGADWITALRAASIRKLAEGGSIQLSLFDEKNLAEISHKDYPGERLIVCRNPFLAGDRSRKREELLRATEAELEKVVIITKRQKRRLQGKDKIGIRVGKVLNRFKVEKHFILQITDDSFYYHRNQNSIHQEAALDGIYVIRTSVAKEKLDDQDTVRAYKNLSLVERAFRCFKTIDLKVRPIHHRLAERVQAHVFLCMLSYYVEWHMRKALAPLLFDEEDKALAESLREDVVAPARRSPGALQKAVSKRTSDGLPVHSFRTLLKDLATLCKNKVRTKKSGSQTFELVTLPTPLQKKAFELLGVSHLL